MLNYSHIFVPWWNSIVLNIKAISFKMKCYFPSENLTNTQMHLIFHFVLHLKLSLITTTLLGSRVQFIYYYFLMFLLELTFSYQRNMQSFSWHDDSVIECAFQLTFFFTHSWRRYTKKYDFVWYYLYVKFEILVGKVSEI